MFKKYISMIPDDFRAAPVPSPLTGTRTLQSLVQKISTVLSDVQADLLDRIETHPDPGISKAGLVGAFTFIKMLLNYEDSAATSKPFKPSEYIHQFIEFAKVCKPSLNFVVDVDKDLALEKFPLPHFLRILSNLVFNALPNTKSTIEVSLTQSASSFNLMVKNDSEKGLSGDQIADLQRRIQRGSPHAKSSGTGLGLINVTEHLLGGRLVFPTPATDANTDVVFTAQLPIQPVKPSRVSLEHDKRDVIKMIHDLQVPMNVLHNVLEHLKGADDSELRSQIDLIQALIASRLERFKAEERSVDPAKRAVSLPLFLEKLGLDVNALPKECLTVQLEDSDALSRSLINLVRLYTFSSSENSPPLFDVSQSSGQLLLRFCPDRYQIFDQVIEYQFLACARAYADLAGIKLPEDFTKPFTIPIPVVATSLRVDQPAKPLFSTSNVMVLNDVGVNLKVISNLVNGLKPHSIAKVASYDEMCEFVKTYAPASPQRDVFLLDINLDKSTTSYAFIPQLLQKNPQAVIVLCSGTIMDEERAAAKQAFASVPHQGVLDYLQVPASKAVMAEVFSRYFQM